MARRLMTVLILVLLIGLFTVTPSHKTEAQGYHFTVTYAGTNVCDVLTAPSSTFVNVVESWNLPTGSTLSRYDSFNGSTPQLVWSVTPLTSFTTPDSLGNTITSPTPLATPYTYTWIFEVTGSFKTQSVVTVACSPPYFNTTGIVTIINPSNGPVPVFTDGRCNQEPDQPVAVYSDNAGGVILYAVHESVGYFALHVPKATFDANPTKPQNYLIVENLGVRVYRLFDGGLQVNRVKTDLSEYAVDLKKCGAG